MVEPRMAAPFVDLEFEINIPAPGMGSAEASPFMEDIPPGLNVVELRSQLSDPHSTLRLKIKERLEKAIIAQARRTEVPRPEVHIHEESKPPVSFTWERELGLREKPTSTGGAYMMRGPTVAEAPFVGGHKYEYTGTKEVTISNMGLPAPYQPYRDDHKQPYGRHSPTTDLPAGQRRLPPEKDPGSRALNMVRVHP